MFAAQQVGWREVTSEFPGEAKNEALTHWKTQDEHLNTYYLCIYIYIYINSHQFLLYHILTQRERLWFTLFSYVLWCVISFAVFFCDLSLWRSSFFLGIPNFETPSQNRWKILGNRPFLWLILRFVFVCEWWHRTSSKKVFFLLCKDC